MSYAQGPQRTGFVPRSISVPALAKERRLATQALVRATESGNVQALRRLKLEAGAELSGCRARDRLGNDPMALLSSSGHLTLCEHKRVRHQLAELPQLSFAAECARQSAADAKALKAPKALALTSLASSVALREHVCQAALADPRLLGAPPDVSSQALPALSKALKSEELALEAVARSPGLLRQDPAVFKTVLPVLSGILGGQAEAAYALAVCPDLLRLQRPQQPREALRAIADCLSMRDGLWMVVQTLLPPSVCLTARAWCREALTGEYRRLEGKEVDERPVFLKRGSGPSDMFLRYSSQARGGCWLFVPTLKGGEGEALALAASPRTSPDQVHSSAWQFRGADGWAPDPYVTIADGGRKRGPCLLTVEPPELRHAFDVLREALGPFWLRAPEGVRFVAHAAVGDTTHTGGNGRFLSLGSFTQEKHGYSMLRLTPKRDSPLRLVAWEPICVTVLYCSEQERDPEAPIALHRLMLEAAGFRPPTVQPQLPELEGLPPVREVLCCCLPQGGGVEVPLPAGEASGGGLAPLVFIRTSVRAVAGSAGEPCEVVKAKVGEPLCYGAEAVPVLQSAGELGYNSYSLFRPPLEHGGEVDEDEVYLWISSGERLHLVLAHFGTEEPPEWLVAERWQAHQGRLPLVLRTEHGEELSGIAHERSFEPGQHIVLKGAGSGVRSVAFFRLTGEQRPDPLRALLLKQPTLLALGDRVAELVRRLRRELGDEEARSALVGGLAEWPRLCVGTNDTGPWILSHKLRALAAELGEERAKELHPHGTLPQLARRCVVLREALGVEMLEALSVRPQLLAIEAPALEASFRTLAKVLGSEAAQRVLGGRLELLGRPAEIASLVAALQERFGEKLVGPRMRSGEGEWKRWPDFVGVKGLDLHEWLGRVAAQERDGRCWELVQT